VTDRLDWDKANKRDLVRKQGSVSRHSGLGKDGTEDVPTPAADVWVAGELGVPGQHPLVREYGRLPREQRVRRYNEYRSSIEVARAADVARLRSGPLGTPRALRAHYGAVLDDLWRSYFAARNRLRASVKKTHSGRRLRVNWPREMNAPGERLTLLRDLKIVNDSEFKALKAELGRTATRRFTSVPSSATKWTIAWENATRTPL
jgi:hypothetical protein